MSNFEWISPLSEQEKIALAGYKDDTWLDINPCLRSGTLPAAVSFQVLQLDQAILKGRCTEAMTVFRATGQHCLVIKGGSILPDRSFLSTSLRDESLGQFFETTDPVKLIIECPAYTSMAAFEHDDAGGEEHERLLPRGKALRIKSRTFVPNRLDMSKPQGPFNRFYMQLPKDVMVTIYTVEPV